MRSRAALIHLRRSLRHFSSSSSTLASGGSLSASAGHGGGGDSTAYRRSMFRRPETVRQSRLCWNSCSFIGTVVRPVKRFAENSPEPCAYTCLEVSRPSCDSDPSSSSSSSFRIVLAMRGKLSEISLRHLKLNDYIYVRGPLSSYEKVDESGKREIFYKVTVRDLNYVKRNYKNQTSLRFEISGTEEIATSSSSASDSEEKYCDHLRLWQVFFANPHEWWDNRQGKQNPRRPDFKHKDTKECLWINPDDPPWIRKQLQLYDSQMSVVRQGNLSDRKHEWKLEDLD